MTRMRSGRAAAFALLAALTACTAVGGAEARRYVIDPQHFTLGFLVEHVGFAKVLGQFHDAEGSFTFDESTGAVTDVRIAVRTESVDTGVEARDRHLRSADFLHVEEHPEMIFTSAGGTFAERLTEVEIEGELTILGETRPLTLSVTWNKSGTSPLPGNPWVVGMSARGSFLRSDYGMTYGVADGLVGDEVELILELEAQRQ